MTICILVCTIGLVVGGGSEHDFPYNLGLDNVLNSCIIDSIPTNEINKMATVQTMIEKAKAYVEAQVKAGKPQYEVFIECYGQSEWEGVVIQSEWDDNPGTLATWKSAKNLIDTVASVWEDRMSEAAQYEDRGF